jgi:hypothetical protein
MRQTTPSKRHYRTQKTNNGQATGNVTAAPRRAEPSRAEPSRVQMKDKRASSLEEKLKGKAAELAAALHELDTQRRRGSEQHAKYEELKAKLGDGEAAIEMVRLTSLPVLMDADRSVHR